MCLFGFQNEFLLILVILLHSFYFTTFFLSVNFAGLLSFCFLLIVNAIVELVAADFKKMIFFLTVKRICPIVSLAWACYKLVM